MTGLRRMLGCVLALLGLVSGALGQEIIREYGPQAASDTLVVRSTTDISVFGPVVEAFLIGRPRLSVRYEQWGSNELYELTRTACHSGKAAGDVVISSAVHQMVKLVNEACAASYRSAQTANVPGALQWRDQLWGITREPAVMIYNRELVSEGLAPKSRFDLLDLLRPTNSRFAGKVATYDIEASGLGYLFAFADSLEATTFGALQESFSRTGAISTCCSADIIRDVAQGRYLIAYNVLGSYAQGYQLEDERVGIILPEDYTLVLSRALMIPKSAPNRRLAQEFLDFLLSNDGRIALRKTLLLSPLLTPDETGISDANRTTARPIELSPALLVSLDEQTRDLFLRRWRSTFATP
ncbi:ABC transporter substrate-binding protein [Roseibium sp.]|uniref:ABC transporter substrate-binding protein n=1 Tax=Roseibium sp. TaxID=1936156 RepID=UPI003A96E4EE